MPVKLEAQQGVAQGVLIQAVEGHSAPRRGILQACAAYHITFLGIGGWQPAAGATRPGVRGEQDGAAGAELAVCERVRKRSKGSVVRNICGSIYAGGSPVLRNSMRSGCGRERPQTVHTAVLRQPQAVLPAGQTAKDMRNKARHAVVLWVTCRRGKAARPVCRQPQRPASITRSRFNAQEPHATNQCSRGGRCCAPIRVTRCRGAASTRVSWATRKWAFPGRFPQHFRWQACAPSHAPKRAGPP